VLPASELRAQSRESRAVADTPDLRGVSGAKWTVSVGEWPFRRGFCVALAALKTVVAATSPGFESRSHSPLPCWSF
jgi:hypothetical protein